jgi:hypothetical protein
MKKTWLVGGSGSFYSYNQDLSYSSAFTKGKYTNIDISASIGYFLANKFVSGINSTFSSYKGEAIVGGGISNSRKFAIGPFARYYFLEADRQFNILTEASYQFGPNVTPLTRKDKGQINNFSVMAGPELFFNSAVGLVVLMGYKSTKEDIDNSPNAISYKNKGFQVLVGFQIHLEPL